MIVKTYSEFTKIFENKSDDLILYHGSSSSNPFEEFKKDYILSGTGKISYGYGFYFSDDDAVARTYGTSGITYTVSISGGRILTYSTIGMAEKRNIADKFFEYSINTEFGKEAYPNKETQNEFWENECKYILDCENGPDIYGTLLSMCGDDRETSEWLSSIGYAGLEYKDHADAIHSNYVIFDSKYIKILKKVKN